MRAGETIATGRRTARSGDDDQAVGVHPSSATATSPQSSYIVPCPKRIVTARVGYSACWSKSPGVVIVRSLISVVTLGVLLTTRSAVGEAQKRNERPTTQQEPTAPQGMCRVWLNGVRADSQPAPTDCVSALRNRPPNARVIFGKQGDQRSLPRNPAPDTSRRDDPSRSRPDKKRPDKPDKPDDRVRSRR